jgi:hypothetical protein
VVFLDESEPLSGVTHHVEGHKEHLASLFSAMDMKELLHRSTELRTKAIFEWP